MALPGWLWGVSNIAVLWHKVSLLSVCDWTHTSICQESTACHHWQHDLPSFPCCHELHQIIHHVEAPSKTKSDFLFTENICTFLASQMQVGNDTARFLWLWWTHSKETILQALGASKSFFHFLSSLADMSFWPWFLSLIQQHTLFLPCPSDILKCLLCCDLHLVQWTQRRHQMSCLAQTNWFCKQIQGAPHSFVQGDSHAAQEV